MARRRRARVTATVPKDEVPGSSRRPDRSGLPTFYLHPGKLFASAEPTAVMTILGSCVGLCLWDPQAAAGGITHYVLPHGAGTGPAALRFGDVAIPELIQRLLDLGCKSERLQAKIFGGACVIAAFHHSGRHLGTNNIQLARELLSESRIPVTAEDVGCRRGRKVIFHSVDGEAWVKTV